MICQVRTRELVNRDGFSLFLLLSRYGQLGDRNYQEQVIYRRLWVSGCN